MHVHQQIAVIARKNAVSFSGVLDTVSNATAAWSLRVLRAAMIGEPLVRLREDNGDTEADFSIALADLNANGTGTLKNASNQTVAAWRTANGATNVYVADWYDQVGSNTASQNTTADQPQYAASAINSLPACNPASNGQELIFTAIEPVQMYTVVQVTGGSTAIIIGDKEPPAPVFFPFFGTWSTGGNHRARLHDSAAESDFLSTVSYADPVVVCGTYDGVAGVHASGINGDYDATPGSATFGYLVDKMFAYREPAHDLTGYCPEIVMFSTDKRGSGDETTLLNDQADVYGITL